MNYTVKIDTEIKITSLSSLSSLSRLTKTERNDGECKNENQ